MGRFKPYHPKHVPLVSGSGYLLLVVGALMMVSALSPHPNGMTVRFGKYVPPAGVIAYRWFFGLDAAAIWLLVGFNVFMAWRSNRRSSA